MESSIKSLAEIKSLQVRVGNLQKKIGSLTTSVYFLSDTVQNIRGIQKQSDEQLSTRIASFLESTSSIIMRSENTVEEALERQTTAIRNLAKYIDIIVPPSKDNEKKVKDFIGRCG
jgi:predicted  nucleic acid-binding Zn-ribbon protein